MNSVRFKSAFVLTVALIAAVTAASAPASAQGNGHGHAYGSTNKGAATTGPSAAGAPELQAAGGVAGTGIRNFGSWLDDASTLPTGNGAVSLAFSYWRTPAYREFDVPVVDAGLGLAPRLQVNFSVPYYHASQPGGPVVRGLGDLYLSTKVQLKDPSSGGKRIGFSVTPLLEILSFAPAPDVSRVSWALPGSIEIQRDRWRVYGSAGYFSRGSLFASGALEVALSNRTWITGSLSRSHSIKRDDLSAALGLTQTRTDLSGSATVAVTPTLSVFGAVGRTISRRDANSSTFALTSGIALSFSAWRP